MIPYYQFQPTIYLFGIIPIQVWGVMVALGFLAGLFIARKEAERKGLNKEALYDLFTYIFIGGIVGARLFFVLFYWPEDTPRTLYEMLAIWNGGLAFFGGFLGAVIGGYLFTKSRGFSFWQYADAVVPGLVIGHAIGRIGCYLTELHSGKETTVPWALYILNGEFQGQLRHPVVLYEILYLLLIFIILVKLRDHIKQTGTTCAVYGLLYGTARFANDFFREAEGNPLYWGLTATQYCMLIMAVACLTFLVWTRIWTASHEPH